MPRHPAVTAAVILALLATIPLALAPFVYRSERVEPGEPATNGAIVTSLLVGTALLLLLASGMFALIGAIASRRGVRADLVGTTMLTCSVLGPLVVFVVLLALGVVLPAEAVVAMLALCGLTAVGGLIMLLVRPGSRQPHEVSHG